MKKGKIAIGCGIGPARQMAIFFLVIGDGPRSRMLAPRRPLRIFFIFYFEDKFIILIRLASIL